MATTRKARAKAPAETLGEPRYEIKVFNGWHAVDRGNVLRDGCLHWQIGMDEFGIREKGRWRVVK